MYYAVQCAFLPLIIRVMALGLNLMNEEAGTGHIIKKGDDDPSCASSSSDGSTRC